jgi:hypothetical protein
MAIAAGFPEPKSLVICWAFQNRILSFSNWRRRRTRQALVNSSSANSRAPPTGRFAPQLFKIQLQREIIQMVTSSRL